MIKKPMKAPTDPVTEADLRAMSYPIACSAKLDGIRGLRTPEGVFSAAKKLLGNKYMQKCLDDPALNGMDGELVVGLPHKDLNDPDDDVFNRTSGNIRRATGEPDFKFYVFDQFMTPDFSYQTRWIDLLDMARKNVKNPFVVFLEQRICHTFEEAIAYEEELIQQGYEGMMARSLTAPYKQGRATMKEGYIFKRKPVGQDEAIVIDVFEQQENQNEKTTNALGHSVRSSHQENKVGKNTLGGFVLKSTKWDQPFRCGTIIGGTAEYRQKIWDNPQLAIGQIVTYIYQEYGSIDAPRQPRCKAEFRAPEDITKY